MPPKSNSADGIDTDQAPSGTGCVECLAANGWWLHLRRCAQCGAGPQLAVPDSHPQNQPAPGPRERLPKNWQALLHNS